MIQESMMKWRVKRDGRCNSIENEDIRRSIEILDNVLAEFDETGDRCFASNGDAWQGEDDNDNEVILRRRSVADLDCSSSSLSSSSARSSFDSYRPFSIDGSSSQLLQSSPTEQWRKYSPPPIPKRSPGTRLSCKETQFCFPEKTHSDKEIGEQLPSADEKAKPELTFGESSPGCYSDDKANENISGVSENAPITSSRSKNDIISEDEVFLRSGSGPRCCRGCGISLSSKVMSVNLCRSPSVAKRREEFENYSQFSAKERNGKKFLNSDSGIDSSLVSNSPFLRRVPSDTNCERLKFSPALLKDQTNGNKCSSESDISQMYARIIARNEVETNMRGGDRKRAQEGDHTCQEERLLILKERFAMVKLMLKTNKILLLETAPPSFIPKPPRKLRKDTERNDFNTVPNDRSEGDHSIQKPSCDDVIKDGLCDKCLAFEEMRRTQKNEEPSQKDQATGESKETSKIEPVTNTIADLPKLLPTYTLTRPQFGLDCDMEDDFCPGAKDILTSTPKSEKIHLSTFSQSASSLGYVSSQSDQDLNSTFSDCEKIPIVSLKSQTLPTGIRMIPPLSYSGDPVAESDIVGLEKSLDLSKPPKSDHFRSSSAPPLKHLQPPERKGLFGMSRKEKKLKSKHDDSLSLKSNSSSEDGVYLRKIAALDGSTELKKIKDYQEDDPISDDKGKRKSVWKSILRRK